MNKFKYLCEKLAVVAAVEEFNMGCTRGLQFENSALNEISVANAQIRDKAKGVLKLNRDIPGYKKIENALKYKNICLIGEIRKIVG